MSHAQIGTTLLLSKPDIAALAKVQRPVVTMWITRHRASSTPFPAPVSRRGREEVFRGSDVVEWLRARGLGNSESLLEDLAMYAALDHGSVLDADVVFHGLTALLCVKDMLGHELTGLDAADLLDEADELDPDDDFLFGEIEALGDYLPIFAEYADRMSDAAYNPRQAFESLMAQRFRMQRAELADSALAPRALDLCARLCAALVTDADCVFVDPSADGSDLLVALRGVLPESDEPIATTGELPTAASRLARRRLAIHHWRRRGAPAEGFGADFTIDGPAMFLTQFPSPATVGLSEAQILASIDNIVLQMADEHCGVVIAPASALVDPLRDRESRLLRAGVLRSDRVRAIVRLPEGLLTTRPGLSMALWILGAADPSIKPAERWTVLADLGATELDDATAERLIADVTAAMGTRRSVWAHAFHFGVLAQTATLLADDRRALTPSTGRRRRRGPSGAESAGRAIELIDAVNRVADLARSTLQLDLEYREAGAPRLPTIGALLADRDIRLVPGNRIDESDIEGGNGIRIIGTDEIVGVSRIGCRRIDRLVFARQYPSGRYTEPGDIVFCTNPRFGAIVDHEGSAVVHSPARILRVVDPSDSGLLPDLVARHLMSTVPGTRPSQAIRSGNDWKSWQVPKVPFAEIKRVQSAFDDLRERRHSAAELLDHLDQLTSTLVDGLAHGVLTVAEPVIVTTEKG